MTVLAVASVKHSPGATTLALALATAWATDSARQSAAVVVEADPAGGDLAARLGLRAEPGLASLAAEARHGGPIDVGAHAQPLPCGGWVVPAPLSPAAAEACVATLASRLSAAAAPAELTVVDCGRWAPGSPADAVLAGCDRVVIVARPDLEGIDHVLVRLEALRGMAGARLALVLVGHRPYAAADVAAATGVADVAAVPIDGTGAYAVSGGGWRPQAAGRSRLARSARGLLAGWVASAVPA